MPLGAPSDPATGTLPMPQDRHLEPLRLFGNEARLLPGLLPA